MSAPRGKARNRFVKGTSEPRWNRLSEIERGIIAGDLRQIASAMSTGTAKTPKAVEGRSPASAAPSGETPE
jgi:hypothetical protein